MQDTLSKLLHDVTSCPVLESLACGKGKLKPAKARRRAGGVDPLSVDTHEFDVHERVTTVVNACREERKRRRVEDEELTDEHLSKLAKYTDKHNLVDYERFLHFVPRLVNIVRPLPPILASLFTNVFSCRLPWRKQFRCQTLALRCRSTYAPLRPDAVAPTLRRVDLLQFSWHSLHRAVAS